MVDLLEHNQAAYEKVKKILQTNNKTCVIQPTGSGKSYLILKLVEDCEEQERDIIVIEPQKYIFNQLREKMDKYGLPVMNVKFITYSALGKVNNEKIKQFNSPQLVIVDEMHRAGAPKWRNGLQKMFDGFPDDCKYIGFSATPIRFLDGRKDMSEELFDGCIANEIGLADAILNRILPLPRYIAGIYDYSKDVSAINKKISQSCNSEEEKKELLEEVSLMKKNLDKSKGISSIFKKYIVGGKGKYVAFCHNIEHLQKMRPCLEEWFSEAGLMVNLYEVHCKNLENNKQFKSFMDDDGLAVCLSISMLSEGVHGIDGVILLRGTISPNLYYQQIGRVFSVDMDTVPIIFDLVANCESIIDCNLKNDLLDAIDKRDGEKQIFDENIMNGGVAEITRKDIENFFVFDQVIDSINAFKNIEERLIDNWENGLKHFDKYMREHDGDVLVPQRYRDEDGFYIGNWVSLRRAEYKNSQLSPDKVAVLEKRGFIWDIKRYEFLLKVDNVKRFVEKNKKLPKSTSEDKYEKSLGIFLVGERANQKKEKVYPKWRKEAMEEISGFSWNPADNYFFLGCKYYKEYAKRNSSSNVPDGYKTEDGFNLGSWVSSQKNKYRRNELPDNQKIILEKIGFVFSENNKNFDKTFALLVEYLEVNQCDSRNIPQATIYKGEKLGEFVSRMRAAYKKNCISNYRKEKLQSIGFIWSVFDQQWNDNLKWIKEYKDNHNGCIDITKKDRSLKHYYEWFVEQKRLYNKGQMREDRKKLFEQVIIS